MFQTKDRATYLLLPSSVAKDHVRLGRLVTDILAPGHNYAPQEPSQPDIQGFQSTPVVQKEARGVFRHEKYASLRNQLSELLNIDFDLDASDDTHWKTGVLTTNTLINHLKYLRRIEQDARYKELREFISDAWYPADRRDRKDVFLIVGVKEWTHAEVETVRTDKNTMQVGGKVPIGAATQLPTTALDASAQAAAGTSHSAEHSGQFTGDLVFAVQYRRIRKPRKGGMSLEDARKLGPSVFGDEGRDGSDFDHGVSYGEDNDLELEDIGLDLLDDAGDFNCVEIGNEDLIYPQCKQ